MNALTGSQNAVSVDVRFFAAAAAALGRESASVLLHDGCRLGELIALIEVEAQQHTDDGASVGRVLARCSFIVNGASTTDRSIPIAHGDRVDVLPPFAGG